MNKFLLSSMIAATAVLAFSTAYAKECNGVPVSTQNKIFAINDGELEQLTKLRSNRFALKEYQLDSLMPGNDRTLLIVATGFEDDYDAPVVIKVIALSTKGPKTEVIALHRPEMNGRRAFIDDRYSLAQYNKHHYPENGADDDKLHKNFHFKYRDRNGDAARTDDTDDKRRKFIFSEAPNEYQGVVGGLLDSIFGSRGSKADPGEKFPVYLKAELGNLLVSNCVRFTTRIPARAEEVRIEIRALDEGGSDDAWRFKGDR